MNVETGELFNSEEAREIMEEMLKKGQDTSVIRPVPKRLEKEAKEKLGGKNKTVIDMSKQSPLAKWANKEHSRLNRPSKKRKRKIAQSSKRRNRG
jgi:polyhydroxyalkanoate synthesis regulator phasin